MRCGVGCCASGGIRVRGAVCLRPTLLRVESRSIFARRLVDGRGEAVRSLSRLHRPVTLQTAGNADAGNGQWGRCWFNACYRRMSEQAGVPPWWSKKEKRERERNNVMAQGATSSSGYCYTDYDQHPFVFFSTRPNAAAATFVLGPPVKIGRPFALVRWPSAGRPRNGGCMQLRLRRAFDTRKGPRTSLGPQTARPPFQPS